MHLIFLSVIKGSFIQMKPKDTTTSEMRRRNQLLLKCLQPSISSNTPVCIDKNKCAKAGRNEYCCSYSDLHLFAFFEFSNKS